jgi:protein-S-isoprenylcysteine O-methyltransferase Ste14
LYTAVFCGALGWALVCASWPALAAALCLGPFLNAKASIEERALRERFPDYEAYQAQVKRFIPGIY